MDHPMNIPTKFGFNQPSSFREEDWNVMFTDIDRHKDDNI